MGSVTALIECGSLHLLVEANVWVRITNGSSARASGVIKFINNALWGIGLGQETYYTFILPHSLPGVNINTRFCLSYYSNITQTNYYLDRARHAVAPLLHSGYAIVQIAELANSQITHTAIRTVRRSPQVDGRNECRQAAMQRLRR
jgi:hypothetical protein